MVTKPSTEQSQDFSIHNEDFPALPGPNYKDPTLSADESKSVSVTQCFNPFSKPHDQIAKIVMFVPFLFCCQFSRTWTHQPRAAPVQMAPSSQVIRHQHRTTTSRKRGSRCCLMVSFYWNPSCLMSWRLSQSSHTVSHAFIQPNKQMISFQSYLKGSHNLHFKRYL